MKRHILLFFVLLSLTVLMVVTPAMASAGPDIANSEFEFAGTIDSIGPSSWVIAGMTLSVDSNTVIDESKGAAVVGAY